MSGITTWFSSMQTFYWVTVNKALVINTAYEITFTVAFSLSG